jgi:hypothetical protein
MKSIQQVATRYRRSRQVYEKAFRCFFQEQVQALPTARFWELQPVFADAVHTYRFGYDRTNGVEQAAGEFFRKALAQDFHGFGSRDIPAYALTEALQFAKRWRTLASELDDALSQVVEHRSDDAYGDLLDALPLAGHDLCTQALDGRFRENSDLEDGVRLACSATPGMTRLILRGENYVATALYDAAREYYPSLCRPAG